MGTHMPQGTDIPTESLGQATSLYSCSSLAIMAHSVQVPYLHKGS